MSEKKSSGFWPIFLWTVVMILSLTAAVISMVFITNEGDELLSLLGFGIAGYFFVVAIQKIMQVDQVWKAQVKNEIKNETADILAVWSCPPDSWKAFVLKVLAEKRKGAFLAFIVIISLVAIGMIIAGFNAEEEGDLEDFLKIVLPIITAITILGVYIMHRHLQQLKNIYLISDHHTAKPEVIVAKKGVLMNGHYLTSFNASSISLIAISLAEKFGQPCLKLSVKISGGDADSTHHHYIPTITASQKEEAKQVIEVLQNHYQLSAS